MTLSRILKYSIGTTVLTGALIAAPIAAFAQDQGYPDQSSQEQNYNQDQQAGAPVTQVAPPTIPDYQQPPAPGDGYIWTPGYWAWTTDGYVWVNGAWVLPPYVNALWTPGYWGYNPYGYFWNAGYWGPYVGYYGGINYGFGYFGVGFYGGYWGGGRFWYNRPYCNLGYGRGFHVYDHPYSGFRGHAGGASFSRVNVHGTAFRGNRGSSINGRSFAERGSSFNRGSAFNGNRAASFNQGRFNSFGNTNSAHTQFRSANSNAARFSNGGVNNAPRTQFRSAYNGAARYNGSPNYSSRSFSAAPRANYSAPRSNYSAPRANYGGGGGFHGGGGGGGFHGGGGGGFHGGGGGGSHGGGGRR